MPSTPPNLRVGMIALTNPDNPNQLSGMPHAMASSLRQQGVEVVPLLARDQGDGANPHSLRERVRRAHQRRTPMTVKRWLDQGFPGSVRRSFLTRAEAMSARVAAGIAALDQPVDLLFGVCIAAAVYDLRTELPIVYFSDATSPLVDASYPRYAGRGQAFRDARRELERTSLSRVAHAVFAAPCTLRSAIDDLGLDPARGSVVPMGAHVTPADPSSVHAPTPPPTVKDCRLLIVAADPIRKRVDLAARTAETLRRMGVHATLSVVGPGTVFSRSCEAVDSVGPLKLSSPDDAVRHRNLLRSCHIQVLPSLGEAFGIAPAESAHFARPAVVADSGGLPFVIQHDRTGLVLPVEADHHAWATAISALVRDPERYRRYSAAALARARAELNWSAWASTMIGIMHQTLDQRLTARSSGG